MRLLSRYWQELQFSEGLTEAQESASKMAHSHSCWQEVLVLQLVGLSSGLLECPHDTVARFPQTDGSERERKNKHQEQGFCSLVLDCTPSFPFSSIIRNKSLRPHSCGGELGFTS